MGVPPVKLVAISVQQNPGTPSKGADLFQDMTGVQRFRNHQSQSSQKQETWEVRPGQGRSLSTISLTHTHTRPGGIRVPTPASTGVSGVPVWLSLRLQRHPAWPWPHPHPLSVFCKMSSNYAAGDAFWVCRLFVRDQSNIPSTTVSMPGKPASINLSCLRSVTRD